MEHRVRVEIKVYIGSNPIHMHMLHRSKHRDRVKIKVDIENSPQTTSISLAKERVEIRSRFDVSFAKTDSFLIERSGSN